MCTEGRFKRISHEERGGKQYPASNVAWEVRDFRVCFSSSFLLFSSITPLLCLSHLLKSFGHNNMKKVLPVNRLH